MYRLRCSDTDTVFPFDFWYRCACNDDVNVNSSFTLLPLSPSPHRVAMLQVDEVDEVHDDVLKRLGIDLDQDSDEEAAPPKADGGRKRGGSSKKKRRSTKR